MEMQRSPFTLRCTGVADGVRGGAWDVLNGSVAAEACGGRYCLSFCCFVHSCTYRIGPNWGAYQVQYGEVAVYA